MFKSFLVLIITASVLFASETMYGIYVKEVSLMPDMKDIAGKLLPTNAIEVLSSELLPLL